MPPTSEQQEREALPPLPDAHWVEEFSHGTLVYTTDQMHAYARAALATKAVPAGFEWPKPPPRKGQSPVLFDDGYDEGWAKCIDTLKTMLAATPPAPAPEADRPGFDAEGFREWVKRELPNDTIIGSSAYWADRLTAWAQRFAKVPAQAQQANRSGNG